MDNSLIRDGLPLWPLSLERPEAWAGWTPFGAVLSLVFGTSLIVLVLAVFSAAGPAEVC